MRFDVETNKVVWSYIEDEQMEMYQNMWPVVLSNISGVKNAVWVALVQYSTESIVTEYVEDQLHYIKDETRRL